MLTIGQADPPKTSRQMLNELKSGPLSTQFNSDFADSAD
jgi:hypothetical protein